jgi:hypothetical protein
LYSLKTQAVYFKLNFTEIFGKRAQNCTKQAVAVARDLPKFIIGSILDISGNGRQQNVESGSKFKKA